MSDTTKAVAFGDRYKLKDIHNWIMDIHNLIMEYI